MVFFLMTIMILFFILFTAITVFLSVYKKGKLLKKKWIFMIISIITFLELLAGFTALPTNFIIKKVIIGGFITFLVGNLFVYSKKFNTSRLILGITSIAALIALLEF